MSYVMNLLTPQQCEMLRDYYFDLEKQGLLEPWDSGSPYDSKQTMVFNHDEIGNQILHFLHPQMEKVFGKRLYPTYTYGRIYRKGYRLDFHRDREACENSCTIQIASDGSKPWPIWVDQTEGLREFQLSDGQGIPYFGCEQLHGRYEFQGEWHIQLFIHYVPVESESGKLLQRFNVMRDYKNIDFHVDDGQLRLSWRPPKGQGENVEKLFAI